MVADAGLTMQQRAPLTPLVKLVFGADYDKTRITEYAAALSHAQRQGLGYGELAAFLAQAHGGLKGVVALERKLRREESGKAEPGARASIADSLRALLHRPLYALEPEGPEFALVVVRAEGWELRCLPSTWVKSTIGGFISGGSAGIGSAAELDAATSGLLGRLAATGELTGRRYECVPLLAAPGIRAGQLVVVIHTVTLQQMGVETEYSCSFSVNLSSSQLPVNY
jgi:hypothetical protein